MNEIGEFERTAYKLRGKLALFTEKHNILDKQGEQEIADVLFDILRQAKKDLKKAAKTDDPKKGFINIANWIAKYLGTNETFLYEVKIR